MIFREYYLDYSVSFLNLFIGMTGKQNVEFSFRKKLEPKHVHQLSIRNIVSEYMVSQVVLFPCRDKYHRLRWKKSPPQQSTFMSTMVGPAQKIGRSSWEQAINLPNHATILLRPCWSGIVKKRKEKISFSIRKWPTSWRNRIKAKKHIENWRKRMAKKELFLIELVMFLFKKTTAWKTSKNDNQTYIRTQQTVRSHCQTCKKLSSTCDINNKRKKK